MNRKNSAQIHVFEVIIVAGLLLVSLYFVKSFDFTPHSVVSKENKLEIEGINILEHLEGIADPTEEYDNLLARFADGKDEDVFTDYINNTLPEGTLYKVQVIDISSMNQNSDTDIASYTTTPIPPRLEIGRETYVKRVVVIDGNIYQVVLGIYYTLR